MARDRSNADILCQIVTPVGMLGYGFSESETSVALEEAKKTAAPVALILDAGSTDSGPSKLALGSMTVPRSAYVRDLRSLIRLGASFHAPLLFASAGGDGSDEHVDEMLDIIRELAGEAEHKSWNLNVLAIFSGMPKDLVRERLNIDRVAGCGPAVPDLTHEDIDNTPRIVAQMGPEPFLEAMLANPGFDVVVGGRAYDPAPYVAYCAFHAVRAGIAERDLTTLDPRQLGAYTHMGKIMECGGICCTPKSRGASATMFKDSSFSVKPIDQGAKCVPLSVAAHTLYEKTRPDLLHGPGGVLDLTQSTYVQAEDGRSVLVHGSAFRHHKAEEELYTVKLEGARVTGYRTLIMGSFHDPILIPQIHDFLAKIEGEIKNNPSTPKEYKLTWHVYGFRSDATEVFVVGECLAPSQDNANSVAAAARVCLMHGSYPGQKATSGNFAFGIGGKMTLEMSECAEFSVYHLMSLELGEEYLKSVSRNGLFTLKRQQIGIGPAANGTRTESLTLQTIEPANDILRTAVAAAKEPAPESTSRAPQTLIDLAKVVRSKNAGPFEITMDVIFDNRRTFDLVKSSGLLTPERMADLYDLDLEEIIWCGWFDPALAFKCTIPRMRGGKRYASGGFGERDVHGSTQYIPLASIKLPEELLSALQRLEA